jgi:hypothetical protein
VNLMSNDHIESSMQCSVILLILLVSHVSWWQHFVSINNAEINIVYINL